MNDQRFWNKVDKSGDCWIWLGARDRNGYGQVRRDNKTLNAYRYAYSFEHELILGLTIDHLCGQRLCVRPSHLEQVSHRVNILRSNNTAARNAKKTHCPLGHDLQVRPDGKGRYCPICKQRQRRERYLRSKV